MKITVGLTLDTVVSTGLKGKYGHTGKAVYNSIGAVAVEKVLRKKFTLKADTLSKCQGHPNVITCHAIELDTPYMYIITELGIGTYDNVLNKTYTGPPIGDCRNQLYQITNGLAHIHGLGCVHKDLNPLSVQIILPDSIGVPVLKLSNFGFSRVLHDQEKEIYGLMSNCDMWFMSPELYDSNEFIFSMDIFSLGCIWTMALSFSHPFGSKELAIDRIKKKQQMKLTLKDFKNVEGEEARLVYPLVKSMLSFVPGSRPTALDILKHSYLARLEENKFFVTPISFQQEENGISPTAIPTFVVGNQVGDLENNFNLEDLKPCLVFEGSDLFESNSGKTEGSLELVVKEENFQPSLLSERNETNDCAPEMNELSRQPQHSQLAQSTSSNEIMEVVESTADKYEEEPFSELFTLNPLPVDTEIGYVVEGCTAWETPNQTFLLPPGGKAMAMPFMSFISDPEPDHSRDPSECMKYEADPSLVSTHTTFSASIHVSMTDEESPTTTGNNEMHIQETQEEIEFTTPAEEVASTEAAIPDLKPIIAPSTDRSAINISTALRKKGPSKVKAPKATKSLQSSIKRPWSNKRMRVDSFEVVKQQESMDEAHITTNSQEPVQIQNPVLPDDEPSSSSQHRESQLVEEFVHSRNPSLTDEYALSVRERVKVGMSVSFTERGFERVSGLKQGDTGVVLSIDSVDSLTALNVEVDWHTKGIYFVRYQQIKLQPDVTVDVTSKWSPNGSPTPSLSPLPLTVIIPNDNVYLNDQISSQKTPSPPQLVSLYMNDSPLPVLQLPPSQTSPPLSPVENEVTSTLRRSTHNLRSRSSLPRTPETPPKQSTSTSKPKQSASKTIQSKLPKNPKEQVDPPSSKSNKKLLPPKEEELLHLSSLPSLSEQQVARFVELVADIELNVNCKRYSSTPILLLCRNNQNESLYPCLKSILAREDVDLQITNHGNNALMLLSRYYPLSNPLIDCIRLLVNRGMDINMKNCKENSKTALFFLSQNTLISKNLIDVARLLINENSDFKIARKTADALGKRSLRRDGDILLKIIDSYRPGQGRVNNKKEEELLKLCCLFSFNTNQLKRFEELILDKEVDLNSLDNHHRSPLILLCRHLKSERLAEFLSTLFNRCSIDPNIQDNDQWNALISACYYYHNQHLVEVVRLLLARDINVKSVTSRGSNALYALCCIHCGDVPNVTEVIRVLLDGGVEINGEKSALLAWCVNNIRTPNFIPVITLLTERGIDLSPKDERGRNCLMLICDQHKNGSGLLEIVRLLIENHIDVDARDYEGLNVIEILNNRPITIDPEVIHLLKSVMSNNLV